MSLTIGIDASRLQGETTGVARYTIALLKSLDGSLPNAHFVLFSRHGCNIPLPSSRWLLQCDRHPLFSHLPALIWVRWRLGTLLRARPVDVFWAPNTLVPRGMRHVAPYIATVHDFRHVFFPKDLPPLLRYAHKMWFRECLLGASAVIANSHGTSVRMKELFGLYADIVAPPILPQLPAVATGTEADAVIAALGVRTPFFMMVGRSRCKNVKNVIAAIDILKSRNEIKDFQLALVGQKQWGEDRLVRRKIRDYNWIVAVGRVDDKALAALYQASDALLFPSIYEGFGIPVYEAISAGTRVVTTDSIELREAGGASAIYIEPTVDGIMRGIEVALHRMKPTDGRTTCGATLKISAAALGGLFRSVAGAGRPVPPS